jgi:hypothetical protein
VILEMREIMRHFFKRRCIGTGAQVPLALHQVPLAHGAIGASNADGIALHQVPLARGAIGASNE